MSDETGNASATQETSTIATNQDPGTTSVSMETGALSVAQTTTTTTDTEAGQSGSFKIGKILYDVTLSDWKLSWIKKGETVDKAVCVPVEEILSVHKIHGVRGKEGSSLFEGFTVQYVSHKKKHILRREFVQFLQVEGSHGEGEKWCEMIKEAVDKVRDRPHKLLVFVNPASGGSNGKKIYETTAAGVFKEAQIETDVIITERRRHCEEILSVYDLSTVDGIVLVSGDGMYHEAVNGLKHRLMKEAGLNENDPGASLLPVPLPIGLIPAGTGNGIATGCYGNTDPETAALAIVIGKTRQNNIISVHSEGELVGYAGLFVGYGFWADMIQNSDNRRHLGVLRYPVTIVDSLLIKAKRQMDLTVDYLPPQMSTEPLTVDYLPPQMSTEQCQDNKPIKPDQQKVDQSAITKDQPIRTAQIENYQSEVNESQADGDSGPMKTAGADTDPALAKDKGEANIVKDQVESHPDTEVKKTNKESTETGSSDSKWESCQGIYTGACVTIGALKVASDKAVPVEDCTRLILNQPSGRIQSLLFMVELMSQEHKALENPLVDHMLVKEYKVKLNKLSDPESDSGKKEHMMVLDGEIYRLKQPQFHARLHPKLVKLFVSTSHDWTVRWPQTREQCMQKSQ